MTLVISFLVSQTYPCHPELVSGSFFVISGFLNFFDTNIMMIASFIIFI